MLRLPFVVTTGKGNWQVASDFASCKSDMSEKILVVEDELTLRETLEYSFQRQGYEVLTAGDGYRALAVARQQSPDLIV